MNYTLFNGGQNYNNVGASSAAVEAKRETLARDYQTIYQDVAQAFYNVLQYEGDIAIHSVVAQGCKPIGEPLTITHDVRLVFRSAFDRERELLEVLGTHALGPVDVRVHGHDAGDGEQRREAGGIRRPYTASGVSSITSMIRVNGIFARSFASFTASAEGASK